MRLYLNKVLLLGSMLLGSGSVYAQGSLPQLLQRINALADPQNVQYDYVVSAYAPATKQVVDEVRGTLQKTSAGYLDSNNKKITISQGGFYLEIEQGKHHATYCDYATMAKKRKLSTTMEPTTIRIPDALILQYGKITIDSLSENDLYKITVDLKAAEIVIKNISVWLDKKTRSIRQIAYDYYLEGDGISSADASFRLLIQNIKAPSADAVAIRRFLSPGRQPRLLGRYSGYSLKSVTL